MYNNEEPTYKGIDDEQNNTVRGGVCVNMDYSIIWEDAKFPMSTSDNGVEFINRRAFEPSAGGSEGERADVDGIYLKIDDSYIINYVSAAMRDYCKVIYSPDEESNTILIWNTNRYVESPSAVCEVYNQLVLNFERLADAFKKEMMSAMKASANATKEQRAAMKKQIDALNRFVKYFMGISRRYHEVNRSRLILAAVANNAVSDSERNYSLAAPKLTKFSVTEMNYRRYIALKNVVVDTERGEVIPNSDTDRLRRECVYLYMDFVYLGADTVSDVFVKHLTDVFTDNTSPELNDEELCFNVEDRSRQEREVFLRYCGYLMRPENEINLFAIWLGEVGGNGKSVCASILADIFGENHCSVASGEFLLSKHGNPSPTIADSLTKRIAIINEFNGNDSAAYRGRDAYNSDYIKTLTGNEMVGQFRKLYKTPLKITPSVKYIAVSNSMPEFSAMDTAFARRLICFPFPHCFTAGNSGIVFDQAAKLAEDRDAIGTMIVNELIAYCREGMLPIPDFMKAKANDCVSPNSIPRRFVEECIIPDNTARTDIKEIYNYYAYYCQKRTGSVSGYTQPNVISHTGVVMSSDQIFVLSKAEQKNVLNAVRNAGITTKIVKGYYKYCCRVNLNGQQKDSETPALKADSSSMGVSA